MQITPLSSVKGSLILRREDKNPLYKTSWVELFQRDPFKDESLRRRILTVKRFTAVPPPREKVPWLYYRERRLPDDEFPMDEYDDNESNSDTASYPDDEMSLTCNPPEDNQNTLEYVERNLDYDPMDMAEEKDLASIDEDEPLLDEYLPYEKSEACVVEQEKLSFARASNFLVDELKFRKSSAPKKPKKPATVVPEKIGGLPVSLAAMIHAAARELRPVPKEHKKQYKPVAVSAAEIGQYLRLKEETIEAVSVGEKDKKKKEEEASWAARRTSLVLMANARSEAFRCVQEAATLGKMTALTPKVIANYNIDSDDDSMEDDSDVDDMLDEHGHKAFRTNHLMNYHIKGIKSKIKIRDWAPQKYLAMQAEVNSMKDVKLPTRQLPSFQKSTRKYSRDEYLDALSVGVAEKAWDRRYRLDRPGIPMKVTLGCDCKYCINPNIFQTALYRKKHTDLIKRRGKILSTPSGMGSTGGLQRDPSGRGILLPGAAVKHSARKPSRRAASSPLTRGGSGPTRGVQRTVSESFAQGIERKAPGRNVQRTLSGDRVDIGAIQRTLSGRGLGLGSGSSRSLQSNSSSRSVGSNSGRNVQSSISGQSIEAIQRSLSGRLAGLERNETPVQLQERRV